MFCMVSDVCFFSRLHDNAGHRYLFNCVFLAIDVSSMWWWDDKWYPLWSNHWQFHDVGGGRIIFIVFGLFFNGSNIGYLVPSYKRKCICLHVLKTGFVDLF